MHLDGYRLLVYDLYNDRIESQLGRVGDAFVALRQPSLNYLLCVLSSVESASVPFFEVLGYYRDLGEFLTCHAGAVDVSMGNSPLVRSVSVLQRALD